MPRVERGLRQIPQQLLRGGPARVAAYAVPAAEDAGPVRVQDGVGQVPGEGEDRGRGVAPYPGQGQPGVHVAGPGVSRDCRDRPGRGAQVTRAGVVAEAGPFL